MFTEGVCTMKKLLIPFLAVLALAGTTNATSESTADVTVNITATGFQPDEVVVRPGDTVTWRNRDTKPHRIISRTNAFPPSPMLAPGRSYSFRFGTPSAYSYESTAMPSKLGYVFVRGGRTTAFVGLSRLRVVYRNPIRVFGSVDTTQPETVTVTITRYGGPQETRTITTDADGTFQFEDRPPIRTGYKVSWRNGESRREPFVNVRPLVVFEAISLRRNRFFVRVRAQRSYAGKVVLIQGQNRRGTWVTRRRVRLNLRGEARFRGRFARGTTTARAFVPQAPGYAVGFSVIKLITKSR
jgi:plastocyanin